MFMKRLFVLFTICLYACSSTSNDSFKITFMSNCAPGDDPITLEYCKCIYSKLEIKYSDDFKKLVAHDWNNEETKNWIQDCISN